VIGRDSYQQFSSLFLDGYDIYSGSKININSVQQVLERDTISIVLGGISSTAALIGLIPPLKTGAFFVGGIATAANVGYSYYQYKQGKISPNELRLRVALDVAPLFGKGVARIVSKKIYEAAGGGFDIIQHQISLGETLYETIYKPHKKD
jgi:hypothetical protein